eukprot:Amastigsp_a2130_43.p3 type:complete len:110 gc:universal Amastigsp_a2130_43:817-488(-)
MIPRLALEEPRNGVARVGHVRLDESIPKERQPDGADARASEHDDEDRWDLRREHVLDRMRELGRNRHRPDKQMVLLVDGLVGTGDFVKGAVRDVETEVDPEQVEAELDI